MDRQPPTSSFQPQPAAAPVIPPPPPPPSDFPQFFEGVRNNSGQNHGNIANNNATRAMEIMLTNNRGNGVSGFVDRNLPATKIPSPLLPPTSSYNAGQYNFSNAGKNNVTNLTNSASLSHDERMKYQNDVMKLQATSNSNFRAHLHSSGSEFDASVRNQMGSVNSLVQYGQNPRESLDENMHNGRVNGNSRISHVQNNYYGGNASMNGANRDNNINKRASMNHSVSTLSTAVPNASPEMTSRYNDGMQKSLSQNGNNPAGFANFDLSKNGGAAALNGGNGRGSLGIPNGQNMHNSQMHNSQQMYNNCQQMSGKYGHFNGSTNTANSFGQSSHQQTPDSSANLAHMNQMQHSQLFSSQGNHMQQNTQNGHPPLHTNPAHNHQNDNYNSIHEHYRNEGARMLNRQAPVNPPSVHDYHKRGNMNNATQNMPNGLGVNMANFNRNSYGGNNVSSNQRGNSHKMDERLLAQQQYLFSNNIGNTMDNGFNSNRHSQHGNVKHGNSNSTNGNSRQGQYVPVQPRWQPVNNGNGSAAHNQMNTSNTEAARKSLFSNGNSIKDSPQQQFQTGMISSKSEIASAQVQISTKAVTTSLHDGSNSMSNTSHSFAPSEGSSTGASEKVAQYEKFSASSLNKTTSKDSNKPKAAYHAFASMSTAHSLGEGSFNSNVTGFSGGKKVSDSFELDLNPENFDQLEKSMSNPDDEDNRFCFESWIVGWCIF